MRRLVWGFVCFVFCYCCFYYLNTFIYVIALPVFVVVMQFCFGLGNFELMLVSFLCSYGHTNLKLVGYT